MASNSLLEAIPWLVAIAGWGFTHVFSEARERRKEVRSQLDKSYEQLQKLEQESRSFHCAGSFDEAKSLELTSKVAVLERVLLRISIVDAEFLNPLIVALRRSITLDNFEKSSFEQQTAASHILAEISHCSQELEGCLEQLYGQRYPNKFPYFKTDWLD